MRDYWKRGPLGLALPPDLLTNPYVCVLCTYGRGPGAVRPTWGNECIEPPAGLGGSPNGCVVTGRLSRLPAVGS